MKNCRLKRFIYSYPIVALFLLSALFGCGSENSSSSLTGAQTYEAVDLGPRSYEVGALIYNGSGAAAGSVNGLVEIAERNDLSYHLVSASELNKMTIEDLSRYGVILWPGGLAGTMTKALTREARARVREAVIVRGVSYAGFCAGSWMAVGPIGKDGSTPDWGLAIVPAENILPEYPPNGKIMNMSNGPMIVTVTLADGNKQDLVFWGGSYFPDAKSAIARYKDGKPAIVQAVSGQGYLVLAGPHPESEESWHSSYDADGTEIDQELGWKLIESALNRKPLPVF